MGTEPRDKGEPGMPEPLADGGGDNDGTGNGDNGGGEAADDVFPPGWGAGLAPVLVIDAIVVVGSLPLIWFTPWGVSPGFWFAGALVILAFVTFAGMLATTGSMRASLAATLFLLFLVMAIFVLNIDAFGRAVSGNDFTKSVFQTLTAGFTTVLVFYFGSEAYVTATRIKEREQTKRARARGGGGRHPAPEAGSGVESGGPVSP